MLFISTVSRKRLIEATNCLIMSLSV